VNEEAMRVIQKDKKNSKFTAKHLNNRQGPFVAESIGYSHGGGQRQPSNTKHSARNLKVLTGILANPAIQRLSGLVNSAYKKFSPGMHEEYTKCNELHHQWKPSLRQNFKNSVFAATTINYGDENDQTVAGDHLDHGNYAPGGCTVSNVGNHDDTKGGEMVLWNLGVVLRFPAVTSIIINSAIVRHQNLPVQPGERRYSITQYSAGALFRYVFNGFRNDKDRL
ncbi:hypothetical protein BDP27DRAFT_1171801, partial [Rhodocollybia butyracea]